MAEKNKRLTIGLLFDDSLDRPDGVQQQVRLIGEWLSGRGHNVHYLVGQTNDFKPVNGILHSLSRNISVRANQNRLSLPILTNQRQIVRLFENHSFDLIHAMLPYSPFLGRSVLVQAQKHQVCCVGTFHTYPATAWQHFGSRLYGKAIKSRLNSFSELMSVSDATAAYVRQAFGVDSRIVPNAVSASLYKAAKSNPKLREGAETLIVFVGRMDERKGAQYLVEAIQALDAETKNLIKVQICGRGPLQDELKSSIARYGLEKTIKLPGFISEEEKRQYLASADLAVFPATGGEAFGIVLTEAMAAGTAVLAGDNAGYRSVLSNVPQSLFNPRDINQFSNTLKHFIRNAEDRRQLQLAQSEQLDKYDIELIGRKLEEIYEQSIARNRSI